MNNAILITRPNHDLVTTYLFHWSNFVIEEAMRKATKILDLKGKKANQKTLISYIRKHQPILIFFNGHGSEDVITGYDNEILVEANKNEKVAPISLLKGNTTKDAFRKSQDAMWRNFRFMLSTRATQSQKDAAPYLWFNRKYQVILGDQDAKM